jgi:hypothetical protein
MRLKSFEVRSTEVEGPMRTKREIETDEHRHERFERNAQRRSEDAAAEGKDMDARVERSIKLYGP